MDARLSLNTGKLTFCARRKLQSTQILFCKWHPSRRFPSQTIPIKRETFPCHTVIMLVSNHSIVALYCSFICQGFSDWICFSYRFFKAKLSKYLKKSLDIISSSCQKNLIIPKTCMYHTLRCISFSQCASPAVLYPAYIFVCCCRGSLLLIWVIHKQSQRH